MSKVYCSNCANFTCYYGSDGAPPDEYCIGSKGLVDTPARRKSVAIDYKKENADNNCQFYTPSLCRNISNFFKGVKETS